MPLHTGYPLEGDLLKFLIAMGLIANPKGSLDQYLEPSEAIAAASAKWENDTGLVPFVKDSADQTVYYDPPGQHGMKGIFGTQRGGGRSLYLPAAFGSVFSSITSVTIGYGLTQAGTVLTVNQDYWLEPQNAALNNRPYEWITFAAQQWGSIRSVVIVGKRGWPVMPDDAWKAVLNQGFVEMAPQVQVLRSQGLLMFKSSTVEEQYGPKPFADSIDRAAALYQKAVNMYKVPVL